MAAEIIFWKSPRRQVIYTVGIGVCALLGLGAVYLILCTAVNWWLGFNRSLTGTYWGTVMGLALILALGAVVGDTFFCRYKDLAKRNRLVITDRRVYGLAQGEPFDYPLWQVVALEAGDSHTLWVGTLSGGIRLRGMPAPQTAVLAFRNARQAMDKDSRPSLPEKVMRVHMTISSAQAHEGGKRDLLLPGYEPVQVQIPVGVHSGTVLCLPRLVLQKKGRTQTEEKRVYITVYVREDKGLSGRELS